MSNGLVTLEGTVDLLGEREDAERAVRTLAGVRGVTDKIAVVGTQRETGSPSMNRRLYRRLLFTVAGSSRTP